MTEKKTYVCPEMCIHRLKGISLLYTASPGIGEDWAKRNDFFEEDADDKWNSNQEGTVRRYQWEDTD